MYLSPYWHRRIYLFALVLVSVGLSFSKAVISIGEIILAVNFFLEGNWRARWTILKSDQTLWLFLAVFVMHLIGLLWTEDLPYGFRDVKNKIPLLLFPLIIALSQKLNRNEFLWIVATFSSGVILASFASTWAFFELRQNPGADFRTISLFNSHIRFSLMVCLAFLILLNCAWNEKKKTWVRISYVMFAIWLSIFLFILQSMTGIVVWFACGYMLLYYTLFYIKNTSIKWISVTTLILIPLLLASYLAIQIDEFYPDELPNFKTLEKTTAEGEGYSHDTNSLALENGYFVNLYVALDEVEREWNLKSSIPFKGGKDAKDQMIYSTLLRYLTSKGLRKDAAGIRALSVEDVKAIENGVANYRFLHGNPIQNRVYIVIWEFDKLFREKNVQGHSVTQRFEFIRTGWNVFKENFWHGVGTGDILNSYRYMYDRMDSKLTFDHRLKSHNQYLSIGIAYGIFGLLLFLISLIFPFFRLKNANTFLYIGFAIILYLSMFNEDTLETQSGVTLYAFFNAFLLYALRSLSLSDEVNTSS